MDPDGESLKIGISARPFLINPKEYELQRLIGKPIKNDKEIVKASKEFCAKGVEVVFDSLGKKGAIMVTKDVAFKLDAPEVETRSKVGAGDSLIGGFLVALENKRDIREAARYGVAAGTAAVITEGTKLCLHKDVERLFRRVKVKSISI